MPGVAVSAGVVGGASYGPGTLLVGSDQFLVTGAIEANVINRADPVPNTPLIDFGARRVGDAAGSAFVSVTNQASALPQAALNASIGGASSPFSASGSFMQLAPNATDATSLQVGLATGTAGNFSGGATITLVSDASNIGNCDPNCTVDLDAQVVQLAGRAMPRQKQRSAAAR